MSSIEPQVEAIVDTILEDYRNGRAIDKIDHFRHPDKEIVTDMIGKLMRIVYPGATREKAYRIYNARHNLSMLIEDVMYNLNKQLTLLYTSELGEQAAAEKAQELSLAFFRAIPEVRAVAQTDVEAFFDGDPAAFSVDEIIFCYPGLFAVTVYRLAHVLYALGVPLLPRIMTEHAHSITGIDINPGATIGKFLRLPVRQAQHMKGKPLGGFAANAGKPRKLIRQILQRRRKKLHVDLLRRGRPGSDRQ